MKQSGKQKHIILKYLGGSTVGFINGLLGAGGGMLAVPLLKKLGLETKESHATSIAVILPLSLFSCILYLTSGRVTLGDALPYIPFGIIGALIGAWLMPRISTILLRRIFGGFMIWAAIRLLLK